MAALTAIAAQVAPVNETQYTARTYIAAATITAGQTVYENSSGKVDLARANATGTIQKFRGIALNAAVAGKPVEVMKEGSIPAVALGASALAYGAVVYVLASAAGGIDGAITTGTGNFVVPIGTVTAMTDADLTKVVYVDVKYSDIFTAL